MLGGFFGTSAAQSTLSNGNIAAAQNLLVSNSNVSQGAYNRAVSHESGQYLGVDVRISKAENGFIVSVEGRRFIAESVEDVTGIIAVQMIAMESK
jgi:hypothetical protein